MSVSVALPSSVSREAKSIPASAKAASVGAKTVNGPAPCRVATSSAWARAATSELCMVVAWAVMAMFTAGTHAYASHTVWLTVGSATWLTML